MSVSTLKHLNFLLGKKLNVIFHSSYIWFTACSPGNLQIKFFSLNRKAYYFFRISMKWKFIFLSIVEIYSM